MATNPLYALKQIHPSVLKAWLACVWGGRWSNILGHLLPPHILHLKCQDQRRAGVTYRDDKDMNMNHISYVTTHLQIGANVVRAHAHFACEIGRSD